MAHARNCHGGNGGTSTIPACKGPRQHGDGTGLEGILACEVAEGVFCPEKHWIRQPRTVITRKTVMEINLAGLGFNGDGASIFVKALPEGRRVYVGECLVYLGKVKEYERQARYWHKIGG